MSMARGASRPPPPCAREPPAPADLGRKPGCLPPPAPRRPPLKGACGILRAARRYNNEGMLYRRLDSRLQTLCLEKGLYSSLNFMATNSMLVDITPDKSLVKKLGLSGYRTEQALAELVDNSIDARIDGARETVAVLLDFDGRRIVVSDDGRGMDGERLAGAMV